MKLGIMQPYFFPYLGYWQLINVVDKYIIYDDVNYIKRGWINRNRILYKGEPRYVNLLIRDASQNRLIKDTEIAQNMNDSQRFLKLIVEAYRKAPYFEDTYDVIKKILMYDDKCLSTFLKYQIEVICEYLGIKTDIVLSSEIKKDNFLKGEEKIINICKVEDANMYINAYGGRSLYHEDEFAKEKIELKFLKMDPIKYKQFANEFVPGLSIIDVMMFNDLDALKEMLYAFKLVGTGELD